MIRQLQQAFTAASFIFITLLPALGYSQSLEADMVHRLELALNRPFAASQRRDLEAAARTAMDGVRKDKSAFVSEASRITGMAASEVEAAMAAPGASPNNETEADFMSALEKHKGAALTAPQKDELKKAEAQYKTAVYPQREGFVRDAAFILDLDPREIRLLLPRIGL
ncbi:MAG: hypothetical protein R3E60_04265 [Alphaproteobacteria bacterium]